MKRHLSWIIFWFGLLPAGAGAQSKPNFLILVVDDGRYDMYPFSNGPSWFQCPNIERIADEGVNFKYCFPATSVCAPSRANIVTGLYPHHTGVVKNGVSDSLTVPTIATVLHDEGYHVGFVGKYGFNKWPVPGLDYWFTSANDEYWDTYYNYNGQWKVILGHKTNIFNDSAEAFLRRAPEDQPWCLFLFHKAPHAPFHPRTEDTLLFVNETMPVPENFYPHTIDFPNYFFECHVFNGDSAFLAAEYLKYYQLLAGIEWSVGEMFTLLEDSSELDQTMVIYTSDNGLIRGEHKLSGKQLPLEESTRLPMLIRFPKLFEGGSVVADRMASLVDIAPTVFEAAAVNTPPSTDGISLIKLYNGTADRQEFLYEFNNVEECTPTIHALRTFDFLYVESSCTNEVRELYDLQADSLMNWNVINKAAYAAVVPVLKQKLDSLRIALGDTIWTDTIIPCFLYSTVPTAAGEILDEPDRFFIYPNPGGRVFQLHSNHPLQGMLELEIYNAVGHKVFEWKAVVTGAASIPVVLDENISGLLLMRIRSDQEQKELKFLKLLQ